MASMEKNVVISIDAMGGDYGARAVVGGMKRFIKFHTSQNNSNNIKFIIYGDQKILDKLMRRSKTLRDKFEIIHTPDTISMNEKAGTAMRNGRNSSMWNAIKAVKNKTADAVVSCGNTGALLAMSMVALRKVPGINRPAIAGMWPCNSTIGYKLALDMGANVQVDAQNLVDFSVMGAEYARLYMGLDKPRIGLLNIGHENSKGHHIVQTASQNLSTLSQKKKLNFEYIGFVEGGDFFKDSVDVIVSDGFTGNIALKTAEGTARFITDNMKDAFKYSWASRLGALIAYSSLRRLKKRLDPSQANGGVFLGLNGTVVKSHGSSNAVAFAAAIKVAVKLAESNFIEKMTQQITSVHEDHSYKNSHIDLLSKKNSLSQIVVPT